jgi:WD40-like Beta Propeller Repeat
MNGVSVKRMIKHIFVLSSLVFCLIWNPHCLQAQFMVDPSKEWFTVETEHFRVHYPEELQSFTQRILSSMESIHEQVTVLVGYGLQEKVDVLVMDPYGVPNGMAIPFLGFSRIILWATSPVPESVFGGRSDWGELVFGHEDTHIVHLNRRAGNWSERLMSYILPVGPVTLKSPLWAVEGLAVLSESRLTGTGRAQSSLRATFLRQMALEGKLPDYSDLNGTDEWFGGRIPYLAGSAFLEWLQKKSGNPDAYLHLWKRLSARKKRNFDEAFSGLFEGQPEDLYDRFRAELIAEAFTIEKTVNDIGRVEGDKWADFNGFTGRPAFSPDGKLMAVIRREKHKPLKLQILSTVNTEDEKDRKKKEEPDPEDIPDKTWKPAERKQVATFVTRNGIRPSDPRWFPDNETVIFSSPVLGSDGMYHHDLFRWTYTTGDLTRLTRGADLQMPDVSPDGTWVVAVRRRHGTSALVRVSVFSKEIEWLTEPALDLSWGAPRISPGGERIAAACWGKGFSEVRLLFCDGQNDEILTADNRTILAFPAWSSDGSGLYYMSDQSGIFNLEYCNLTTGEESQLTMTTGGAFSPEPDKLAEGYVYYLSTDSKGYDIFRLKSGTSIAAGKTFLANYPLTPPDAPVQPEDFEQRRVAPGSAYGFGPRQEFAFSAGGGWTPSGRSFEAGFNGGDVLGRASYLLMLSHGSSGATQGLSFSAKYSRWPVILRFQGFWNKLQPSEQDDVQIVSTLLPDRKTRGASLAAAWSRPGRIFSIACEGIGLSERIDDESNDQSFSKHILGAGTDFCGRGTYGQTGISTCIKANIQTGWTDGDNWSQIRAQSRIAVQYRQASLSVQYGRGKTYGDYSSMDAFHTGGWISSVESVIDQHGRVSAPYFPAGIMVGRQFEQWRIEAAPTASFPIMFFGESTRVWCEDIKPDPIRVAGIEITGSIPAISLAKLPSTGIRAGVVRLFDDPFKDKWRGYITLSMTL